MKTWIKWIIPAALSLVAAAAQAQRATDTVETAAGQSTTVLPGSSDQAFLDETAKGDLAEVKLGQLAMKKGSSPTIKDFGQRMVADHGKANDELGKIAAKKNYPMPNELTGKQQATYDKLSKLSGPAFDKAYMDAMVKEHDHDVKAFKREASTTGLDPDLQSFAKQTLNVIEEHDRMAHQGQSALKK